jgi:hypothetical protein
MTDVVNANSPAQADEDKLSITAPAPNEMFHRRVIARRNAELEAVPEFADRALPKSQVRALLKERRRLDRQIKRSPNFKPYQAEIENIRTVFGSTRERLLALKGQAAAVGPDQEKRNAIVTEARRLVEQKRTLAASARRLERDHADLVALIARRDRVVMQLDHHKKCLDRERYHEKLRQQMAKEAYEWHDILQNELTRLGFCYRFMHKGKERTHKIGFSEIHVTTDTVQLKLATNYKLLFGWRPLLPRDVYVGDIADKKTLAELTNACQRQVNAKMTADNGTWLIVNRLGSTDGILEYVTLAQVLSAYPTPMRDAFPIIFGIKEGRELHVHYLPKDVHILIGGETGGGKSNINNVILSTLIQMHSPDELRLVLLDLKEGVEFSAYEDVPHLGIPVINDLHQAVDVLGRLEAYRRERMKRIGTKRLARDIDEYNLRVPPSERMPRVVVMIDEYAAIKGVSSELENAIQGYILQLASKARAAGIYLILSTQMPYVSILPGAAKGNLSFRLAFRMASAANSQTIIDAADAANLPKIDGRAVGKRGADRFQLQTPHCRISDIERALTKAATWQPARIPFELPPPEISISFMDNELIDIGLAEFGGRLPAREIWQLVRADKDVSYNQVREMVKRVSRQKTVVHEGVTYAFGVGKGNVVTMKPVEDAQLQAAIGGTGTNLGAEASAE